MSYKESDHLTDRIQQLARRRQFLHRLHGDLQRCLEAGGLSEVEVTDKAGQMGLIEGIDRDLEHLEQHIKFIFGLLS